MPHQRLRGERLQLIRSPEEPSHEISPEHSTDTSNLNVIPRGILCDTEHDRAGPYKYSTIYFLNLS